MTHQVCTDGETREVVVERCEGCPFAVYSEYAGRYLCQQSDHELSGLDEVPDHCPLTVAPILVRLAREG